MGNCLGSPNDEANTRAIDRPFVASSSSSSSSGASGPITGVSAISESIQSYSGNSHLSLATSRSSVYRERSPGGETSGTPRLRLFSFSELKAAADGFKTENELGEGGFGKVYKGWIAVNPSMQSKIVVAIKKLNSQSFQGFEQWQSEVNLFGSLSHPNFVKLLGYCWEDKELLLVYEYMKKGSLDNHLFRRSVEQLSWDRRINIALGAAQGLAYLHTDRQIIYRDFKASNVLLDRKYNAKLSDFGLAKLGPSGEQSHLMTRVFGTSGYAAPEYVEKGCLYVKSDVYGFGVVLLEMLTGRRVINLNRPVEQRNLVEYTKNILPNKRKLPTIIDRRIEGQYPFKAAVKIAQLTQKCLRQRPETRPSMTEVVEILQLIKSMNNRSKYAKKSVSSSFSFFLPGCC